MVNLFAGIVSVPVEDTQQCRFSASVDGRIEKRSTVAIKTARAPCT